MFRKSLEVEYYGCLLLSLPVTPKGTRPPPPPAVHQPSTLSLVQGPVFLVVVHDKLSKAELSSSLEAFILVAHLLAVERYAKT